MVTIDSKIDILKSFQSGAKDSPLRAGGSPRRKPGLHDSDSDGDFFVSGLHSALDSRNFIFLVPVALIHGIVLFRLAGSQPDIFAALSVAALFVAIAVVRSRTRVSRPAIVIASVATGFALMCVKSATDGTRMLTYPVVVDAFAGSIERVVSVRENGVTLLIRPGEKQPDNRLSGIRLLRLTVRSGHLPDVSFETGDRISGRVRFAPVPKPLAPGAYDAQFSSYFDGIGAYGSSLGIIEMSASGRNSLRATTERIRFGIARLIDLALDGEKAGVAKALIIGDQTGISDELRSHIAKAGLAHILAISGLHLALVAGFVLVAVRVMAISVAVADQWVRPVAITVALFVAVAYLMISGSNMATQRATIMLFLAFGAMMFGRRAITMRNLAFAGILIIVLYPAAIFKPGFQLSFAAVTGLVAIYSEFGKNWLRAPRWVRGIADLALTSIIAGAVTAPIAAIHFQQFAPLGLFGNIVAVPIVGFWVLPSGFLAVLLMPFGLHAAGLQPMGLGIDLIIRIATTISSNSGDMVTTPVFSSWTLFASLLALAWLGFFNGWIKLVGPAVFVPVFLFFGTAEKPVFLISDTTQAVMANIGEEFRIVGRKYRSFTLQVWSERFEHELLEFDGLGNCDRRGCHARIADTAISVVKSRAAFYEDCGIADILVVKIRGNFSCSQGVVVTQRQLDRNGVAAVYKDAAGGWRIEWAVSDHIRAWRP